MNKVIVCGIQLVVRRGLIDWRAFRTLPFLKFSMSKQLIQQLLERTRTRNEKEKEKEKDKEKDKAQKN